MKPHNLIILCLLAGSCFAQIPPVSVSKSKYDYSINSKPLPAGAHFEIWYQEQAPVGFMEYNNHVVRGNLTNGTVVLPDIPIWVICIAFDTNGMQYKSWAGYPTNIPVLPIEPAPLIYLAKSKMTNTFIQKTFNEQLSAVSYVVLEHSKDLSNWSTISNYIFTNSLMNLTNASYPAEFFRMVIKSNIIYMQ